MEELLRHATITIRSMWRYRWIGLAVAWSVAAIGFTTILFIPDRYEASARIYVNTASILKPLMTGLTVQPNDDQRIAGLSHILITRPNVEKLVQTVGLDANSKSSEEYDRLIDRIPETQPRLRQTLQIIRDLGLCEPIAPGFLPRLTERGVEQLARCRG